MKLALATTTPEIRATVPVALLSGSFAERLHKAVDLGYDGVELMVARPNELDAMEIRSQVSKYGLEIAAIASGAVYMTDQLTLLASNSEVSRRAEERLNALIGFAAAVSAPLVTVGSFRGRLAWSNNLRARAELIRIFKGAAEKASAQNVRLVIEPLNRYESDIINDATEGIAFIRQVGHSHIGLLLDTFHVNIEEPSIYNCFRQAMAEHRLWHVHIGDSNRLPPGQGHMDFAGIVNTLREIDYQGYLSAELYPRPDPDTAAADTIRYMRQLLSRQEKA
jgi:sugar phosphate isomerase/epimerase